nr:hypothetical protein BaRGS_011403 [Batillaria attramentaria]
MECPVCHEEFSQPKILPCAHLLCRDCLVTWLKSEGEAECPLCRCAIVAATKHRACPEVTELEEKVKEAQAVLSELAAVLSAGESELERAMSELDQHLIQTEKNTQSALADIDAACDRLQKCVEASAPLEGTGPGRPVGRSGGCPCTDLPVNAKVITMATLMIDPQALARVEKELAELGNVDVVNASPQPAPPVTVWRFHDNHGQFITLSEDGTGGHQVSTQRSDFDRVMTVDPASHSCSSVDYALRLPSAYVMCDTYIQCPGKQQRESCSVGAALTSVGVGDRGEFWWTPLGVLHLYVNGADQGVAARDVPHPCYAIFDLWAYWKKVTTLPARTVN